MWLGRPARFQAVITPECPRSARTSAAPLALTRSVKTSRSSPYSANGLASSRRIRPSPDRRPNAGDPMARPPSGSASVSLVMSLRGDPGRSSNTPTGRPTARCVRRPPSASRTTPGQDVPESLRQVDGGEAISACNPSAGRGGRWALFSKRPRRAIALRGREGSRFAGGYWARRRPIPDRSRSVFGPRRPSRRGQGTTRCPPGSRSRGRWADRRQRSSP